MASAMSYLLGSHNVADLITPVGVEVSMDTFSDLHNLEKQFISDMKIVFNVKNLTASAFVELNWKDSQFSVG